MRQIMYVRYGTGVTSLFDLVFVVFDNLILSITIMIELKKHTHIYSYKSQLPTLQNTYISSLKVTLLVYNIRNKRIK